ncbi:hypothetical protein FSP39_009340 [Pinctada imbricata]|uniref:Uncharacterized protein n=1 Tax=Pinctada imbricata TaxID=66713 RepID=A0AA88XIF2_PINIB|nr:hypothetical protein FSP39_009340 [Pinctada imbricata]
MGKNKQNKAKKEHAVFKVAGVRKAKTKTVNTNLKKLNVKNKNKTEEANKKFEEVQKVLTQETSKSKVRTASKVCIFRVLTRTWMSKYKARGQNGHVLLTREQIFKLLF